MMRVVVETPCEKCGEHHADNSGGWLSSTRCVSPGGSRRVLTPGEFLLVEKVDGEWPNWAWHAVHGGDSVFQPGAILDVLAVGEGS